MKNEGMSCQRENEVVLALRADDFTDELRAHIAGCESCGEALAVASVCQAAPAPRTVPDASLLWRKMELRLKRERTEAAVRPAIIAERLSAGVFAVCAMLTIPWLAAQSPLLAIVAVAALALVGLSAASVYWLAASKR
jgi:hypothetical protein